MFDRISMEGHKEGSLESILEADEDNFEIPYSEIKKIEMKKAGIADKLWSAHRTGYMKTYAGTLEIHTLSKKDRFEISSFGQDFEQCEKWFAWFCLRNLSSNDYYIAPYPLYKLDFRSLTFLI